MVIIMSTSFVSHSVAFNSTLETCLIVKSFVVIPFLLCACVCLYVCESMFVVSMHVCLSYVIRTKENNVGQSRRFMQNFDVFATKLTLALMFNAKVGRPLSMKFVKRCKDWRENIVFVIITLLYEEKYGRVMTKETCKRKSKKGKDNNVMTQNTRN